MERYETFEHAGFTVEIGMEEYTENMSPRDWDNLGTMVCWHPDYTLGDLQFLNPEGRGAVHRDRHGSASTLLQSEHGRADFPSMETVERYLRLAHKAVVILPLYLLDHSGLSMRAGSNTVGRGDTACGGRDSWGNPNGWDTTMVGFVYTTAERIGELCGAPQLETDPFYCPRTWPADGRSGKNWEGTAEAWVAKQLAGEVETYSQWLGGEVYYWLVRDEDGDILESCGGYFRDEQGDGLDYIRQEAREAAEGERDARATRARETRQGWALARVSA